MSKELDYNQVMPILVKADQVFTEQHGCGAPYQEWDKALETSVAEYNRDNGTSFDPVEARHQYIEKQEAMFESEIDVPVDDLVVSTSNNRTIH